MQLIMWFFRRLSDKDSELIFGAERHQKENRRIVFVSLELMHVTAIARYHVMQVTFLFNADYIFIEIVSKIFSLTK